MSIIVFEGLTFGLNRILDAAAELNQKLVLFTHDPSLYQYELENGASGRIEIMVVDTLDIDAVLDVAQALDDVCGVINWTDTWGKVGISLANRLGVSSQSLECFDRVRDKCEMRNLLHRSSLSGSSSFRVDEDDLGREIDLERIQHPIIIKEVSGTGSRNVWASETPSETRTKIAEIRDNYFSGPLTLEPFFDGTLFSVETISWEGETKVLAVTSRVMSFDFQFREDALSLPVKFAAKQHEQISTWICDVLATLGYEQGFAHTEFVVMPSGLEVIEVNPRLAGSLVGEMLCLTNGINVHRAFVEMALGTRPTLLSLSHHVASGSACVLIYADEPGVYFPYAATDDFSRLPGAPRFYTAIPPGKRIEHIGEYRALLGTVLAEGHSAEMALLNAYSAANRIVKNVKQPSSLGREEC